ncbi:MAG: LysR family transcriptional regulator [Gammaproteobacteria bacterium]|nr:LysR family transcriptional regulator [Gammaproteobacteria bacterium]MBM4232721.1 LysR family transcriptional regulator [Gammaproteobacteria bacterium]
MKLAQLRDLVTIVESGFSISAAAEKPHISQSLVSRQLKVLEDEVGLEFFVRDGKALTRLHPQGSAGL